MLIAKISRLKKGMRSRELEFEKLKGLIEDNENDKFQFIFHTEELLKSIDGNFEDVSIDLEELNLTLESGYHGIE